MKTNGYLGGDPPAKLPSFKNQMAEIKASVCAARAFTDECIKLHNIQKLDEHLASLNKCW